LLFSSLSLLPSPFHLNTTSPSPCQLTDFNTKDTKERRSLSLQLRLPLSHCSSSGRLLSLSLPQFLWVVKLIRWDDTWHSYSSAWQMGIAQS
jgi:hypothetical protein